MKKYNMKKLIKIFTASILVFCFMQDTYSLEKNTLIAKKVFYDIYVDNNKKDVSNIVNIDGSTYISLRELNNIFGYGTEWDAGNQAVHISKMYNDLSFDPLISEEGDLGDGISYKYFGYQDYQEFDIVKYIVGGDYYISRQLEEKVIARTPFEAAAKVKDIEALWGGNLPSETMLEVRYDVKTCSWMIKKDISKTGYMHMGGQSFCTININDGTITRYSDGKK